MRISDLKKSIREMIVAELSEAGEKTALVTTRSGTTAIDYKTPDELRSIGDNTDVVSVKTGAGQKIKEAPNPLSKQLADIKDQISRLTKQIERLKSQENELESALGINEVDENQINEMASIKQIKDKLLKKGESDKVKKLEQAEENTINKYKEQYGKDLPITSDGRLKGYLSALKKELETQHDINLPALFAQNDDSISQNTIEKNAANQALGVIKKIPGKPASPEVAARKAEEEKAKEEKRAEKAAIRAAKERAKAPAQKSSFSTYEKSTVVDMGPPDEELKKSEKDAKELEKNIPKAKKPSKLSAEEQVEFEKVLNGIKAKVDRIKNKKAKPDDVELLKRAYSNTNNQKLFKKAGYSEEYLKDLVTGIIGGKDKGKDLESDEL